MEINEELNAVRAGMTDEEVVAGWMEPRPDLPAWYSSNSHVSPGKWWVLIPTYGGGMKWVPAEITFERLRTVEARLTGDGTEGNRGQWYEYSQRLVEITNRPEYRYLLKSIINASAEHKVQALAAMIRSTWK